MGGERKEDIGRPPFGLTLSHARRYQKLVKQIFIPDDGYLVTLEDRITMPNPSYVRQMNNAQGYGLAGQE
jgi:hypothetical protein